MIKINNLRTKRIRPLENSTTSQPGNKRQRTVDVNGNPSASPTTRLSLAPTLDNGHAATSNNTFVANNTHTTTASHATTSNNARADVVSVETPGYFAQEEHVLVNASLTAATKLFPRDLSYAIKRNPDPRSDHDLVAAISMTFADALYMNKLDCYMALEITTDKVQHMARELFGIRLETVAGLRYVYLPGSASKILPNPMFTLQGCGCNIIHSTFGSEVSNAIMASPKYQDDMRHARDATDAVSMMVSLSADEGATLSVHLGLWEGTEIKKKLYI
ncbi:hypothetical protein V2G26_021285 [Clonostachys chloroleuca]